MTPLLALDGGAEDRRVIAGRQGLAGPVLASR
jgi:hypothetical protein